MPPEMTKEEKSSEIIAPANKKQKLTMDKDGFSIPSSPRRSRRRAARKIQQPLNVMSKNPYENLSDSDMSVNEIEEKKTAATAVISSQKRDNTTNLVNNRVKPIIVTNTTFLALKNSISTLTLTKEPTYHKRRGNEFAINAASNEDKKKILDKLQEVKLQHFSFTEIADRHMLFVIYNHHEISTDELLANLHEEKVPATKVTKINRSAIDPIFLVSFKKNSTTLNTLQSQHSKINGLSIFWDKHKPRNKKPTQCHRCQRFGHAANNCHLDFRCIKCLEKHEPGACSRTNRDEGQPSCVNCNTAGHASNSSRCPAFVK